MQSIITKYLGPTNYRGARIKATSSGGLSLTISYDHELSTEDAHAKAARALCDKYDWHGELVYGSTKTGFAFVFVFMGQERIKV